MKVIEKGMDRSAEAHFYIEGSVDPLKEYGEYIAADYAVCCYVPVEEGNKPKLSMTFTGTTKEIACDAFVDGVHRKSVTYNPKDIQCFKKKLEIDNFLFVTENGTINSQILVAPLNILKTTKKSELDSRETVGTIELRLYVMRELGVVHEVKNIKYDSPDIDAVVQYNRIPPTFQLDVEKNSAPISKMTEGAIKRRMNSLRPGREPWAVFRFHYRSEEALDEPDLEATFDVKDKKSIKPRILPLETVPPLVVNAETKQSRKRGSHTPSPFPAGTPVIGVNPFLKSPTPVQNNPTTGADPKAKTRTSIFGGSQGLQNRDFHKYGERAITEDVDSPTSASASGETRAASEAPTDDRNLESAPSADVSNKHSLPTMDKDLPCPKRSKPLSIPLVLSQEPLTPQNTSVSDASEVISSENRFFDYRKKLADLRKTYLEKDKELGAIKKEMENYKRCMNEELYRMRQEVLEEEDAFAEKMNHCSKNIKTKSDILTT